MSTHNQHAKTEQLWTTRGWNIIAKMVCVGGVATNTQPKFIQFVAIFWLLKLGCPLTNFEKMKQLFEFLKVKNTPHKRWFDSTSYQMDETMHQIVIKSARAIMQRAKYIAISCDEITTIEN